MGEPLDRKDFLSKAEPRWCTGCGDYGILKAFTNAMSKLGKTREDTVVVSGIGCSSRFPYYTSTYGFHTLHGRAPTVATGIKMANPELGVWMITGDGDGLSIGGNHLMHLMRRNANINVILFNNQIYGLTKGQVSPTSPTGKKSKSSPFGSIDQPINPLLFALATGATFTARVPDSDLPMMTEIFMEADRHKGVSFIEVLQNCLIFNDGAWHDVSKRKQRPANTVMLKHGEPLVFGAENEKALRLKGFEIEVVEKDAVDPAEIVTHDQFSADPTLAYKLATLQYPDFPYPLGILRQVERPVYEQAIHEQADTQLKKVGPSTMQEFLRSGETWEVRDS